MITLHSTEANDVTVLSNVFIDRFMPRAGGEFVKVYIYLLRMLGSPQEAFGLSQMADSLLCTEGDILRALKYWENEKLVSLIYEGNALTGITLLTPRNKADEISVNAEQDFPVQENPLSNLENAAAVSSQDTAFPVPDRTGSSSSSPAPSKPLSESRHLTPDRVKELKQNEDIVQLLYIAEQYLGKTLTPTETRKILFFYDELHMSVDLIDYLIEYCVGRDHRSIRYIETVAMAWKEEGITTVEMAKDSTSRYSKEYFTVLKAMGITNRNPADTEIALINTWTKEYGFTMDLIQEACSRTVLQTGQPSFQYAHKILTGWFKKGALTPEAVHALDVQHQKRSQDNSRGRSQTPKSPNRFNNFQQRNYDFKELEKQLLERQNPYFQQPH